MSTQVMSAWTMLLATDAPALPSAWLMQMGLRLSWSVVLAWLGGVLAVRWTANKPVQLFTSEVSAT